MCPILVFLGRRRLTPETALALVMPGGLSSRRPPERDPLRAIARPRDPRTPSSIPRSSSLASSGRRGVVYPAASLWPPSAEVARYLPDVDRLGPEGALRALGHLAQVGDDVDALRRCGAGRWILWSRAPFAPVLS